MDLRYTYDQNSIVYEVLDREVMLVNLDSGYYYALEGTASDIWQMVAAGTTSSDTVDALLRRYTAERAQVEQAVVDLLAHLVDENLLVPSTGLPSSPSAVPAGADSLDNPLPFTAPAMYKYTDMANLIHMDPIRDFDETSWPRRHPGQPST
jgi:hypothetical protein